MNRNIGDIKWAAGFLEGEAHFGSNRNAPIIQVQQVQKWPLERLSLLFQGKIYFYPSKNKKWGDVWRWELCSINSIALMMTIYSLISPLRKEQIKKCIVNWKKQKRNIYSPFCPRGHRRTLENSYYSPKTGIRECRLCKRIHSKKYAKTYVRKKSHRQLVNKNQLSFLE